MAQKKQPTSEPSPPHPTDPRGPDPLLTHEHCRESALCQAMTPWEPVDRAEAQRMLQECLDRAISLTHMLIGYSWAAAIKGKHMWGTLELLHDLLETGFSMLEYLDEDEPAKEGQP